MATINKPQKVGLTDPNVLRATEAQLAQAAIIANGKSTVSDGEAIFISTTAKATVNGVTLTTSANNQPSDVVTVYSSQGNTYVSSIDQTVKQTFYNQVGVSGIIAGDNITITSTGNNGTGTVTINSTGGGGGGNGATGATGPTGGSGATGATGAGANIGNWVFNNNSATVNNSGYPQLYGGPSGGPEFTYLEEAGNTASYSQTMYINNEDGFYVSLANGDYRFSFAIDGNTYLPSNVILDNGTDGNIDSTGNINITSNGNTSTFDTTGNLSVPGSGYFAGQNLYVGEGANTLTQYGASTLVVSANDTAYIQAVITNVSDVGSADWVAYGHHGTDAGGWVDMGFTSSGFNDANYTITKPGSGYIFAHGFDIATQPVVAGDGSLVLATGEQGNVKDIIFGTGGFLESNEFMRISDSNNQLEFYDHGNITGVGNISARGFVNGSPSPTANSAIGYYTIDNSGQTVALAAAGYVDIPNFSGMLIVDDITSGTVAVWICGGANTVQVSITSTAIHPTLGTMAQNGSGYRWTNNGFGGPFTFTIIRTRNTA
jgi:hypothetical protein